MKKHSLLLAVLFWSLCAIQAFGDTKMEAEDASYSNCKLVTDSKYSGGKALELTESSARITFSFSAAERGKYTIYVGYDGLYGEKKVNISVNAIPMHHRLPRRCTPSSTTTSVRRPSRVL